MADAIVEKGLSVREIERAAQPSQPKKRPRRNSGDPNLTAVERSLGERLGAPVKIASGRIEIAYYGNEDLQRLIEALGG